VNKHNCETADNASYSVDHWITHIVGAETTELSSILVFYLFLTLRIFTTWGKNIITEGASSHQVAALVSVYRQRKNSTVFNDTSEYLKVAEYYQWSHSPGRLAWSEGWRPPGTQSAFIK